MLLGNTEYFIRHAAEDATADNVRDGEGTLANLSGTPSSPATTYGLSHDVPHSAFSFDAFLSI